MENHLDDGDEENARKRDGTWHGGIVLRPKARQTWVSKGNECSREQMDESSRNEHACAKVTNGEEESWGESDTWEVFRKCWE